MVVSTAPAPISSGSYLNYTAPFVYPSTNHPSAIDTLNPASLSSIGSAPTGISSGSYLNPNVTVTIVDNTSGLIDVVTDATQQATANGINTRLVRNTGGLNW